MNHSLIAALLLAAGVLLCAAPARAAQGLPSQPTAVLFFPGEAQITVEEYLNPGAIREGRRFVLTIPAQANPDTFYVNAPGNQVVGIFWYEAEEDMPGDVRSNSALTLPAHRPIMPMNPDDEPSEERRVLLRSYLDVMKEETAMLGRLNTAKARYAFWTRDNSGEKGMGYQDVQNYDKGLEQNLPKVVQEMELFQAELGGLTYRRIKAEAKLREYDNQHRTRDVEILLRTASSGPVKIQYSYIVPAEYGSNYRVNAKPGEGTVGIDQQATLVQRSGMAWKDVDVMLSTTRRDTRIMPGQLHGWFINIYEKDEDSRKVSGGLSRAKDAKYAKHAEMDMMEIATASAPAEPVVTQEELSTFRLWKLGKRTLDSDTPLVVDLSQDVYKAEFYYTLRPSVDPRGYLTAKLTFPEAMELAPGKAQFLVDDTAIGWQSFALDGKEANLFFGADPQISSTMRTIERVEGQQGLISKDRTLTWHWEFTIKNGRSREVDIRVEDPMPFVGNKDIKLEMVSTPKPEQADNLSKNERSVFWPAKLKPGEEYKIDHKVSITAPAGKELSPGRW